jgi:hypothetical protein
MGDLAQLVLRILGSGHFFPDGEWCEKFSFAGGRPGGRFCTLSMREAELMVLTQGWVNAVSIGIVGTSLWRLWNTARGGGLPEDRAKALARAVAQNAGLFVDGYLLLAHTRQNRAEISRSEVCGCLHCEQLYRPAEIAGWVGETAVCPRCGQKTVVGSGAGMVLTRELLHRSHAVAAGG